MAIKTFGNEETRELFHSRTAPSKGCGWEEVKDKAARKLEMIDKATQPQDLWSPPGNKLEKLEPKNSGWWSVRINDQWRIILRWVDEYKRGVEIVDYHD